MSKFALRAVVGSLLLSAAFGASAAKTAYQNLELSGVLQEIPGVSLRCASKFGGTILGYGSSELLGRVTFLSSDCINQNGAIYNFTDGKFMITTLTGELLFANYSGQFVPTGEGTKYVFTNATFSITGGTGRYAKATGSGAILGGEDMATGQGTIQLKGRILLKK